MPEHDASATSEIRATDRDDRATLTEPRKRGRHNGQNMKRISVFESQYRPPYPSPAEAIGAQFPWCI